MGRVALRRQGFLLLPSILQSSRPVFELTTGRYGMVKIFGLERLVGVETLFNLMNARQSPSGSKETGARSEGYNILPFWWF
jgi:hypothetical protein